ncbi:MAG: tRNA (N6-isopentenyl adenosine(37)-C2)-methylthiotransferase MiaB [Alphaproteobacteria bacterium]|nr:tRNA (N6-isopentenyl adenosine(37)-C2)-methylthiotransferase MiaB [Alphaproteobacteria bacterium]
MTKKVHIKTWGCQMNAYDSGRMADVLKALGYTSSEEAEDADLVIFNTCHIREKAAQKLFSELGRLRPLQEAKAAKGERMIVAVAGCVAQAEGKEIQRRAPYVDIVLGPQTYHLLPEMIAKVARENGGVLNTDFPPEPKFDYLPEPSACATSAFVAVQEGCDKFCTYCVVPYTRGAEYSRPPEAIIKEALALTANGAKEITLLGQNVNAYHGESSTGEIWTLARLIEKLADLPGLLRLRMMTSHPRDMGEDLIAAFRDIPKMMPYLHLPVQSGSNVILDAMNRKHTRDDYKRLIDRLRAVRPDLALSSDFIVGFPGETDKDFGDTMKLVREVGFAQSYSFKYSRRPGTPAASMKNQIPEKTKDNRLHELQALLRDQQMGFNQGMVGKTVPVLFDDNGSRKTQVFGRTPWMQPVYVATTAGEHAAFSGMEMNVKIAEATLNNMKGSLV